MSPARGQEADEFLENVDEVNALITGLKSGTISADYIDRKIKARDAEHEAEAERQVKEAEEAERRKYENLSPEEQKNIKAKVDEMIAEKERRERARAAFHEYRSKMPEDKQRATDYDAWDLWTPSDDETDPWMKYTPENPAFKAMEADIDKRHAAQVRARQTAHRKREEGNDAFRAGQFAEALKCYELGLEADKRSLELHGNAAMAALKCEMFVQCIDHATKACELAEFLLETPAHPTAIKCLQRRAAARLQLSHYKDALNDLSLAHRRDPGNAEVEKKLKEANAMYEEARKERGLSGGCAERAPGSTARSTAPISTPCARWRRCALASAGTSATTAGWRPCWRRASSAGFSFGRARAPDCSSCVGCWDSRRATFAAERRSCWVR